MKKKLIEVALPLAAINDACKSDKDRKTGTIRNLHKWFAPMPVPALRALIFAALVDDPGSDQERAELLEVIEKLVASVVDTPDQETLNLARRAIRKSVGDDLPVVLDPFCGGGSTLVEAQRLGLPSEGSDLNPIAVLISKVLTEIPPVVRSEPPLHQSEFATGEETASLAGFIGDVLHYGQSVYDAAKGELADRYPAGPNGDPVIAWFWARTVASPDPRFRGARTPLVGSWWLSKKKGEFGFIQPNVDHAAHRISMTIAEAGSPEPPSKGRCLYSGSSISFEYIRDEGRQGRMGFQMLAMATHGALGRKHFAPTDDHLDAATSAEPEEPPLLELPDDAIGFRVQGYGLTEWREVFTQRQQLALETFARLVRDIYPQVIADGGSSDYARGVAAVLSLCVGKLAQFSSTQCLWKIDSRNGSGKAESAKFGRNDLPMVMDFVETNPFGRSVGDWMQIVQTAVRALRYVEAAGPPSRVRQRDARSAGADVDGRAIVITDPPYFATIGYANLSDYFYVWVRSAASELYPDLFSTVATPKADELIAEPARHDGSLAAAKSYFIHGFSAVFASILRHQRDDLPLVVIYALKEQEELTEDGRLSGGWEAMLEAMLSAGLSITGTWPVRGTGSTRLRGLGANALATYVALVCRPRHPAAVPSTRREFMLALRRELDPAVAVLQHAAIAPVDLAQAVIGPGMGIFSEYSAVYEADGSKMTVRTALALINQVLDEILAQQEGDFDAETRWALAWYEQYGVNEGPFGVAESLSKAKNTAINGLEVAGVLASRAGRVRLLDRADLPANWDPETDLRITVWEIVQHLVRALDQQGEAEAARILRRVGGLGEPARELAYRLYAICERKGWAQEAIAYNALVVAWPELARIAAHQSDVASQAQMELS